VTFEVGRCAAAEVRAAGANLGPVAAIGSCSCVIPPRKPSSLTLSSATEPSPAAGPGAPGWPSRPGSEAPGCAPLGLPRCRALDTKAPAGADYEKFESLCGGGTVRILIVAYCRAGGSPSLRP